MSTYVKSAKSNYQLVPEGTYQAKLEGVRDLGIQSTLYGERELLQFAWDIPPQKNTGGATYRLTRKYTSSLQYESALRRDLLSWSGIEPSPSLDLDTLIGKRATIVIRHNVANQRTYSNVASVLPASDEIID